jgi:hypothetical protein
MTSTTKVPVKYCGDESDVIFRDNELVCGLLDKNQFGASSYGMVHAVNELYGAETAGMFFVVCLLVAAHMHAFFHAIPLRIALHGI